MTFVSQPSDSAICVTPLFAESLKDLSPNCPVQTNTNEGLPLSVCPCATSSVFSPPPQPVSPNIIAPVNTADNIVIHFFFIIIHSFFYYKISCNNMMFQTIIYTSNTSS